MLDNRIPPPLLTALIAFAMWFGASATPATIWQALVAAVFFLVAGAIGLPALWAFRLENTTIDPVRIERASTHVTGGTYRVTRNPMYVSLTVMLVAWAIWLGGPWVWAGPIILALYLDRFQIRPEEREMERRFGAAFARYRRKVRRWL